MLKPQLLQVLILLASVGAASASSAADPNSISGFVELYESTFNRRDVSALVAMFTPDADLIMGNLPAVQGREAISNWWNSYFSRIDPGRKGEFELLSERSLGGGVWLLNVSSKTSGTDGRGKKLEVRLARGTWVLVESGDSWSIAAMRGLPAEGESRVAPGVDR